MKRILSATFVVVVFSFAALAFPIWNSYAAFDTGLGSYVSVFLSDDKANAPAAAISITTLGSPLTENFDTLSNTAGSTTNNLTITGWELTEAGGGARDNEQYSVDTGASNTGDSYSYGAAGSTERALGGIQSGTLIPTFGASYTNNSGATITSLDISYVGEEWRLGTASRIDQLDFQYSLDATSVTTGTWTDVNALDFVTPATTTIGAKDGNAAANRTSLSSTISGLSIPSGATFYIRWNDFNASSADDGLAIDDFSITANGGGPSTNPTGIGATNPTSGDPGFTTVKFTVAVTPGTNPASTGLGVTIDLSSIQGGPTTAMHDDGTNGDVTPGDNIFTVEQLIGAAVTPGVKSIGFTVADAQARSSNGSIPLTVNTPTPDISFDSANLPFGNQQVGNTSSSQMRVVNVGSANLNISAVTSNNPEFAVTGPATPFVVAPAGATKFIDISFTPTSAGPKNATITVTSDDPDEPTATFTVTGNGVEPHNYVVTKTADTTDGTCDSDCSLREAIAAANAEYIADSITFDPAVFATPQTITLNGTELWINAPVTITGPGANLLTVSGNNASRVLHIVEAQSVSISGLRVTEGSMNNADGGGINVDNTEAILNGLWVAGNGVTGTGRGGGIFATGIVSINDSTISGNSSATTGGGVFVGGTFAFNNATVSGNMAVTSGGGIYAAGGTTISSSTIAFNEAPIGSGVISDDTTPTVKNSIIAANVNNATVSDVSGGFNSGGFNLVGNASGATGFVNGVNADQIGDGTVIDPKLSPLAYNGGPVPTHKFDPSSGISPAIDKGKAFDLTLDARGLARTVDLAEVPNADGGDGTDIGAFEVQIPSGAQVVISGRVRTPFGRGIANAVVTLTDVFGTTRKTLTNSFGYYNFPDVVSNESYLVRVTAYRYTFSPQIVNVTDNILDLNFVSEP